ncbi:MAG TPA: hypothetical protein VLL27_01740 [Solirubrobacterales bacterium]|nr:hypothetical protein [Solirubrobacterales bacterium]
MSLLETGSGLWARWQVRAVVAFLTFGLVTFLTYRFGHVRIFTGFFQYDDEGYMLTALHQFTDRGSLYNEVFSQYGPFYFEIWSSFFSVFGIPFTHDSGRSVTLAVWILVSLTVGLASWRIAGSIVLGLVTQVLVFSALVTLVNEPMHAGGMVCILLATILAISCFVREKVSVEAMAGLGAALAALALVKINVGAFAFASVALVCAFSYPLLWQRRWPRVLIEIAFVAIPFLVIASKAGEGWARHYALHVGVAALALVIVLRARVPGRRSGEELYWLLGGFLALALTVLVVIVATGTTLDGLVDGLIKQPLGQADAFSLPLRLTSRAYWLDLLALGGAVGYWYASRGRGNPVNPVWVTLGSLLSILVGVEMALSVVARTPLFDISAVSGSQLEMLGFAWVALLPLGNPSRQPVAFARTLLPALAILQALHAFPVAGSQVAWSVFLLIPVGALCVGNGVRGLQAGLPAGRERRALLTLGSVAAAVVVAVIVNLQLLKPTDEYRAIYDQTPTLDLPGASQLRLPPEEEETFRQVTAAIDANCPAFVMLPGMDSFYVWTEQDPPTGLNATAWTQLFDDDQQRQVIDETRSIDGLCLLRNQPLAEIWSQGPLPEGPLLDYMEEGFRPIGSWGDYTLSQRGPS